ncbi:PaaX family transcriptional regulator C-terminal domain-containing protein [Pseudomonas sp. TH41]|uniref:PaaX family transcriptional regulator C-terminal domain-containing protein n=1 Tax=Pseudomonas sp. TH41 TaxID=2796405 RepID=UPI001A90DF49|nr:PaaX family transcriptional regulator C-terminal domain-containing protein [Pseudomonas sp. TH41]
MTVKPCVKSLVLELLVAKNGVPLQVREAIVACELFGISENNVRVTLARLTIEALLEGAGRGSYQLGPQARDISSQLFAWRSVEQHLRPWDGSYLMVACNALGRSDRNILRQRERSLHMLGFAELDKDLYVRPNNIEPDIESLRRRLIDLGLEPAALVFQAMGFEEAQIQRIQNLWNGELLNDSYRRNCEQLESWALRAEQLRLDAAARESFTLGREAIRQIVFDPLLPQPMVDVALRSEFVAATQRFVDHGHQIWRTFLQQP